MVFLSARPRVLTVPSRPRRYLAPLRARRSSHSPLLSRVMVPIADERAGVIVSQPHRRRRALLRPLNVYFDIPFSSPLYLFIQPRRRRLGAEVPCDTTDLVDLFIIHLFIIDLLGVTRHDMDDGNADTSSRRVLREKSAKLRLYLRGNVPRGALAARGECPEEASAESRRISFRQRMILSSPTTKSANVHLLHNLDHRTEISGTSSSTRIHDDFKNSPRGKGEREEREERRISPAYALP